MPSSIFITKEQSEQKRAQEKQLADAYEATRSAKYPGKIHKFTAYAFINKKIEIDVINGQPCNAKHNGILLGDGTCSLKRVNDTDIEYPIGLSKKFQMISQTYPSFTMTLQNICDGCFDIDESKAYDENGKLIADLTNYDYL